jgi:dTDP-4-dehydrorhamnose reductase
MTPSYDTILLTGAAGRLGTVLRRGLAPLAKTLRLADRVPVTDLGPNEQALTFDLSDEAAVMAAVAGADAIVHFGGAPMERTWDEVLNSSIRGSYHIYEAARKHGVRRVVYASSVHAIGYHRLEDHIDANAPHRPDSLYGLSKIWGGSTGTSSGSRPWRCASSPPSPNRWTGGCSGRGWLSMTASGWSRRRFWLRRSGLPCLSASRTIV